MKTLSLILSCILAMSTALADSPACENLSWFEKADDWRVIVGKEFPGATGEFKTIESNACLVGCISYQFTQNSRYVAVGISRKIQAPFKELHLSLKATESCRLLVRLCDATGKTFQYLREYDKTLGTANYRIEIENPKTVFDGKTPDKQFVFPLTSMWIGIERIGGKTTQGEALFSDIELVR